MSVIRFKTKLFKIRDWTVLKLPQEASLKLPSRGMVLIAGTINGNGQHTQHIKTPLEPDGLGSHWFRVEDDLLTSLGVAAGDTVELSIEPSKAWPEPTLPADLKKALAADREADAIWQDITPMARWDWLRWIGSTSRSETRAKHVKAALSKLKAGTRRPCCFNRAMCTEPYISKGGVLLEPATTAA